MTDHKDFFIGWADTPPAADRRFFLGAGLCTLAATGGLGFGLAKAQKNAGPGTWDQGDLREWRGTITADPFPMLRTVDENGAPRTALLGCLNKCAVRPKIDYLSGGEVVVKGSAIVRGPHLMIATMDHGEWIRAATTDDGPAYDLSFPTPTLLGAADLKGEILDSKCWFGAMRPGEGKVHKACAALCIRGGLPPALYVRSLRATSRLMIIVDADGRAHGDGLLPLVADPIKTAGNVYAHEDLLFLRTDLADIQRL